VRRRPSWPSLRDMRPGIGLPGDGTGPGGRRRTRAGPQRPTRRTNGRPRPRSTFAQNDVPSSPSLIVQRPRPSKNASVAVTSTRHPWTAFLRLSSLSFSAFARNPLSQPFSQIQNASFAVYGSISGKSKVQSDDSRRKMKGKIPGTFVRDEYRYVR